MGKIKSIHAREILDSRGTPTVEVDIELEGTTHSIFGRAAVPSGASTGEAEAIELRDGDNKRYLGKGVSKAVSNVNAEIAKAYTGRSVENQEAFDRELCKMDGTHNKARLGANAILGVSMAYARAEAKLQNKSLIDYIAGLAKTEGRTLPVPMMNIVNGGKHADNSLDIQEFMILPHGFTRFSDALRAGVEVFHALKKALKKKGLSTNVGDEGGFAPVFEGNGPHDQALQTIVGAIEAAGYEPGKQISLALDAAASEFLASPGKYNFEGKTVSVSEMIDYYEKIIGKYPIISLEDALAENDWEGWSQATKRLGGKCQFVGDDLFVTNKQFLQKGIELNVANSILIKVFLRVLSFFFSPANSCRSRW